MNPDPAVVLAIAAIAVFGALAFVAAVLVGARWIVPRVEDWCARQENGFVTALGMSEDAELPWPAKRRARELFLSKLDARQRGSWYLRRRFDVTAPSGRRYWISAYRPFNVSARDAVFCIQVEGRIPVYDKLLAQKLLIEADEQRFLARANIRTLSGRWKPLVAAARERYPVEKRG